jgi:hypothetical protein
VDTEDDHLEGQEEDGFKTKQTCGSHDA